MRQPPFSSARPESAPSHGRKGAPRERSEAARVPRPRRISTSSRLLSVLGLFTSDTPVLEVDDIAAWLACSKATAYRYAADLCAAGLLARFSTAFTLGPRLIELDFLIREYDPLLKVGLPVLRRLRDRTGCDVMMTEMFADRVITVHHERGTDPTTVSFSRGRPLPLCRGAGSKAILAHLPTQQQRKLYDRHHADAAAAGLGTNWSAFRTTLSAIRKAGYALSQGELDRQNVGIGVPLTPPDGAPPGSLVAVMSQTRWDFADRTLVTETVREAGAEIAGLLRELR